MIQSIPFIRSSALILLVTTSVVGCTGLSGNGSLSKKMPWSKDKNKPEPYPNPTRMASTWTPDTLVQTGRTPTRGFGGRIFFYDEKTKAVPVEGELTVHAFQETPDGQQGEVKRYHFTPEQFTQHFSQTDIGASYSVWIPWDAVGGDQTKISLVPSFRAANGRLIQGEQALVALPGKRLAEESVASKRRSATDAMELNNDKSSGMVTTTIPVRSSLSREAMESYPPVRGLAQPTRTAIAKANLPKSQSLQPPAEQVPLEALPEKQPESLATAANATEAMVQVPVNAPTERVSRMGQRPQRLGSRQGVMRASATLPLE